jgi:glycerate 2-kinase
LVGSPDLPLTDSRPTGRSDLLAIAQAAIRAASPSVATRQAAASLDIDTAGRTFLLAIGKAAPAMAEAFVDARPGVITEGLIIGSHLPAQMPSQLRSLQADHPVPGVRSIAAGRAALDVAHTVGPEDALIVLVSGGASALMAVPVSGITLENKQQVTRRLLSAGADIRALNTVRKHLSAVKGGRLAAACRGRVTAWLLSDVVGDDPSVIGSGPTVADRSTFADALAILDRHGGRARFPNPVVAYLERGAAGREAETPKPGSAALRGVTTTIIGSARLSLDGAAEAARRLGYSVRVRDEPVVGEARVAARDHLAWIRNMLDTTRERLCLLSCGETTVTVNGKGRGGRNQEFALALAIALADHPAGLTAASLGTDGIDGPTDAAGAIIDETTMARAASAELSAGGALDENDSWTFFLRLDDLIQTGPTGTNVGDIQIVLADRGAEPS